MEQQFVNEDRVDARARRQRDSARGRARSRGQVLVIFALSIFVFIGMCAVVVDVAWYWANTLRVQRAADAAALAGAVLLPGKVNTGADNAYLRARNEATKNGYTASGRVSRSLVRQVTPATREPRPGGGGNPRRLNVYDHGCRPNLLHARLRDHLDRRHPGREGGVRPPRPHGKPAELLRRRAVHRGRQEHRPQGRDAVRQRLVERRARGRHRQQQPRILRHRERDQPELGHFRAPRGRFVASDPIDGIEVRVQGRYGGSGGTSNTNCQLQVQLSWNGGTSWAPPSATSATTWALPSSDGTVTFGDATSTDDWSGHTWTRADLADGQFMVRLTFNKPACAANRTAEVDTLQVRVTSQAGPRPIVRAGRHPPGTAELLGRLAEPGRAEHPGRCVHDQVPGPRPDHAQRP